MKENKDLVNTKLSKTESELKESPLFLFTKSNKKKSTEEDNKKLNFLVLSTVKDLSKKDMIEISDLHSLEKNKSDISLRKKLILKLPGYKERINLSNIDLNNRCPEKSITSNKSRKDRTEKPNLLFTDMKWKLRTPIHHLRLKITD